MINKTLAKEGQVYTKHHSFEVFRSRINADLNEQTQRVQKAVQKEIRESKDTAKLSVYKAAGKDLSGADAVHDFKMTVHIADELSRIDDGDIGRYVYNRYRYDVYPKRKTIDAFPPYLQIEPTSICNFRCVFCYQTDQEFFSKKSGEMGSMGVDMFKTIIDQIENHVDFISIASRGEPLVCREIDQMLQYCAGKFLGLKMNTNASMLTEKLCHDILSGGINTIVFSADAADEVLYSQLRVGGKLDKILKNIELFNAIKGKHYPNSRIITRVSGVKYNDDQSMESMMQTWGSLVDQIAFVAYNPWENAYQSPLSNVAQPCSDLWRRMFVWHDGKVNPCDTDYRSTLCVGNIKESSISEIWQSQAYDHLRQAHLKGERSKCGPCNRCIVV